MENRLYHPNMEGKACGLGRHTKRPAGPYRNPRSRPPPPPVTSAIAGGCQLSFLLYGAR